ncbi:MAG TPA: hypothetical protein VK112_09605 [Fodinibius sp.]|nr:hypothetical protein [Fodinibius sp.]
MKAVFKTPQEALVSNFKRSIVIGNRVHQASLSLTNELANPVLLKKLSIKDGNGNITSENDVGEHIETGESLGFSLSFGIPVPENIFKKYTVVWKVEYDGKTMEKEGKVGSSNSRSKANTKKPTKVIDISAGKKN